MFLVKEHTHQLLNVLSADWLLLDVHWTNYLREGSWGQINHGPI